LPCAPNGEREAFSFDPSAMLSHTISRKKPGDSIMSINATSGSNTHSTTAASNSQLGAPTLPGQGLMSPDEIMAYVASALNDISGQMDTIRQKIQARQERAREIREAQALFNTLTEGGDATIQRGTEEYEQLMKMLEKFKDDPKLGKAYNSLLTTVGGYTDANGNAVEPTADMATTDELKKALGDRKLVKDEASKIGQYFQDALADLNSDNELVMMDLQKLAQQRNQVTQFSSNMLNAMNEGMKSVIGNIR
jgi:hypothetical protein